MKQKEKKSGGHGQIDVFDEIIVDNFAGGGGASTGIELAAGRVGPLDRELLHELDVLVDGPFLLEQKDIRLRFRGSANQRILDVPRSLAAGEALWWDSPQD